MKKAIVVLVIIVAAVAAYYFMNPYYRIQVGMEKEEVINLLGNPKGIVKIDLTTKRLFSVTMNIGGMPIHDQEAKMPPGEEWIFCYDGIYIKLRADKVQEKRKSEKNPWG